MSSLAFVVPVHGRWTLTRVCLRQLRRTCDDLIEKGIDARAVIVSDERTIRSWVKPLRLGFATAVRDNAATSRRFNDGIQLACDPRFSANPVDYVVPCGSDDWVDHRLFVELPARSTVFGFQHMCFVNESGTELSETFYRADGGTGIRIIPRQLVVDLGYRPCDEDRKHGCDTSMLVNLRRHHGDRMKVAHRISDPRWIVDWKTPGDQLHSYDSVTKVFHVRQTCDPFESLADVYPAEALEEMRRHYELVSA